MLAENRNLEIEFEQLSMAMFNTRMIKAGYFCAKKISYEKEIQHYLNHLWLVLKWATIVKLTDKGFPGVGDVPFQGSVISFFERKTGGNRVISEKNNYLMVNQ